MNPGLQKARRFADCILWLPKCTGIGSCKATEWQRQVDAGEVHTQADIARRPAFQSGVSSTSLIFLANVIGPNGFRKNDIPGVNTNDSWIASAE